MPYLPWFKPILHVKHNSKHMCVNEVLEIRYRIPNGKSIKYFKTLSNTHLDCDGRLVVRIRSECLLLFAWYAWIAFDEFGHHATGRLDTEWQWSDVDQEHVLDRRTGVTTENSGLHRCSVRYGLVGIDRQVQRLAAEEVLTNTQVIKL